jgi:hypothetical protein
MVSAYAIPAPVAVVCAGEPFAMGVAQGGRLASQIRGTYEVLRDIEAFRLKQPWWLPFSWFRRRAGREARTTVAPLINAAAADQYQRVQGIARGSGLGESPLWLLHALEGLLANVRDITDIPPPSGCSALAVRGRMSATGEPVISHNFDYLAVVQPHYTVRETRPSAGYRSIEFTVAPLAGALDGVNERGLAVTYNYAQTIDEGTPGPTISMRISQLLARYETVPAALDWLASCPRWGSGLLMLADAQGNIASQELTPTQADVRLPGEAEDCLFHTNKLRCDRTKVVEVSEQAVFNPRAPRPLRGHRVLDSSRARNARFVGLLAAAGRLDLDGLGSIMADHGRDGQGTDSICMHSDYWTTTACIQCLPRSRALRVSYGPTCRANFVEFAL